MAKQTKTATTKETAANLGFEAKLWQAADALRNNMDAAEYKHVVLGLIFLKYISDAFEAKHAELDTQRKTPRRRSPACPPASAWLDAPRPPGGLQSAAMSCSRSDAPRW